MDEPMSSLLLITAGNSNLRDIRSKLRWAETVQSITSISELRRLVGNSVKFSAIITELTIKDGSGFLVVSKILSLYPAVPVIALHDVFDEEIAAMAFQYGATDFLAPTDQVSSNSFERAVRLANLRVKYNHRSRMLIGRLDQISSRARELACGIRDPVKGLGGQTELAGKVSGSI